MTETARHLADIAKVKPHRQTSPPMGNGEQSETRTGAGGRCLRLPLYVMELFVSQAMQRYRITANWARLAVPAGFRVPCVVPLRMPSATAQAMASVA